MILIVRFNNPTVNLLYCLQLVVMVPGHTSVVWKPCKPGRVMKRCYYKFVSSILLLNNVFKVQIALGLSVVT